MRYSVATLSLATVALAESQIPFFWPGLSAATDVSKQPVASVVSADPTTTILALACPSSASEEDCGWGSQDITLSIISTTIYQASLVAESVSVSFGCTHKDAMTCQMVLPGADQFISISGVDMSSHETGSTTYSGEDAALLTATVTAGEDKLKATGSAQSSGSASSGASSASGASGASTGSQPKSSGASSTGSGAPAQQTGAAARFGVEGAGLLALAGAVAAQVL